MTERDWVFELHQYLQARFAELCEKIGQRVPLAGVRVNPPLEIEESKYFLLGLEAGLFRLDGEGGVESDLLPPPADTNTGRFQIFWRDPVPPRLFREGVSQLSTASALILQRGWLKSHILLEPAIKEHGSVTNGADILVKSKTGELLVGVAVKRSAAELEKLMTDLRACSRRGSHAHDDCGFPQNHPKYEFCASRRPAYFWAVAPEAEICFKINYDGGSIGFEELASLPARSLIE